MSATPITSSKAHILTYRGLEQSTILSQKLKDLGVDLLDISSGGNDLRGKIEVGPSYRAYTTVTAHEFLLADKQRCPSLRTSRRTSPAS